MMDTAIVTADDTKIRSTENGLLMRDDISYDEWLDYGHRLSRRYSAVQWQTGDWINIGENLFGEKYAQALDDLLFSYGTLRNYASICARIPLEVRNSKLTFHQTKHVACLHPTIQKVVIESAVRNEMTGDDILEAVHKILGKTPKPQKSIEGHITGYDGRNLLIEIHVPMNTFEYEQGQPVTIKVK